MDAVAVPGKIKFRIRLLDINGNSLGNKDCTLEWDGVKTKLKTDAVGVLQAEVSSRKDFGFLTVELFKDAAQNPEIPVNLFPQVPADQLAGFKRRLNNLGYLALPSGQVGAMDEKAIRALDRFRFANGLVDSQNLPSGSKAPPLDAPTKNRLENAHDALGPLEALPPSGP